MLGAGRYLLGVAEVSVLAGFATLGASRVRLRLLPQIEGAPAHLATGVLALALLVLAAEVLGTISLLEPAPYLIAVAVAGLVLRLCVKTPGAASAGGAVAGIPRGVEAAPPPSTVGDAAATGPARLSALHSTAEPVGEDVLITARFKEW
jgi:hypothetical protein